MQPSRNPSLVLLPKRDDDRRRHGRIRTEEVVCSLGEVMDLSASGMRVHRKGRCNIKMGDRITVTLTYGNFALPVDARVVHIKKVAFRKHFIGLELEETNPEIRSKLTDLASIASTRRVIPQ